MKRLFWACAGLSLGLHGVLAIAWQPGAAAAATALGNRQPAPLHSRLILRSRLPSPALQAATATATATAALRQQPSLQAAPAPAAEPALSWIGRPPAAVEPAVLAKPAETVIETPAIARTGADTDTDTGTDTGTDTADTAAGWDDYLVRSQLTVAPSPREHILLGYPDDGPAVGRFVLTLTLYIDEAGAVRRVDVVSDEALPDPLRQAARLAFAGKRFSPGERAGDAVKSRIRIEVVYESLALPTFATSASAVTVAAAERATAP